MCLYPRLIKNPKYKQNKKNRGNIPPVSDERVLYVPIGCSNCIECRKQKAREWNVRLQEDIKENTNGKFITLTFSNDSIAKLSQELKEEGYHLDNKLATLAVRRFLERWRKKHRTSLRHWLITELGHNGTENIHLHGIIWSNESIEEIDKHWQYGYTWKGKYVNGKYINYVNGKTVSYIIKYVTKIDLQHQKYKSIILTSPGIGKAYTKSGDFKKNKFNPNGETNELYRSPTGHKMSLPVYWRNKIYDEDEKEVLWLNKLNKETRYILGEAVDVSKETNSYYQILETARELNKQLGYGNNEKNWSREAYENHIRKIKHLSRIRNASGGDFVQTPANPGEDWLI
jgi:hypothetical protein